MRPITIHLPASCSESWDAMTPTGAGRHCVACRKVVVDFTQQTDAQILAYFQQGGSQSCGRFRTDQLDRPLRLAPLPATSRRWLAWVAALATWGLREATSLPALAQVVAAQQLPKRLALRPAAPSERQLHGTVHDANTGQPLAEAAIFLQSENCQTLTDTVGHFSLTVPQVARHQYALVVHCMGYESKTVLLPATQAAVKILAISLQTQQGVVVSGAPGISQQVVVHGYPTSFPELGKVHPLPMPQLTPSWPSHHSFLQRLLQSFRP